MTQWLVTGASGMLGRDLTAILSRRGESVTGLRHADLDLTDQDAVSAAIDRLEPDVVVNCAAWTAVDDAEGSEDKVLAVNGHGPAALASACGQTRCKLVQISTDYVFYGTGAQPYPEDGPVSPQTAYGRSKLAGERAVFGLRGYTENSGKTSCAR